jgi:hypothetical protein
MNDIGSVLDRLQGLLGKGYLLAGVVPALIAAFISAALGYSEVTAIHDAIARITALSGWRTAVLGLGVTFGIAMIGFVFWSLNPIFQGLIAGQFPLPDWTRTPQREEQERLDQDVAHASKDTAAYRQSAPDAEDSRYRAADTWLAMTAAAAEAGAKTKRTATVSAEVEERYGRLLDERREFGVIDWKSMNDFVTLLAADLQAGQPDEPLADLSFGLHEKLIPYAKRRVETAYYAALSQRDSRFPRDVTTIAPTRFGNQVQIQREYGLTRYAIDSELFGVHLLKVAAADAPFASVIEQAKLKLDVSVAMTVMTSVLTVAWVIVLAVVGVNPIIAMALILLGPAITAAFYESSVAAQRGMTQVTRALVDLCRFDVLKAMHIRVPTNNRAERQLWSDLVARAQYTGSSAITYVR